jgi:hypothetical protein
VPSEYTFKEDVDTGADLNIGAGIPGMDKQRAEVAANVDKRSKLNTLISSTLDLLIKKAQDGLNKTKAPSTQSVTAPTSPSSNSPTTINPV